MNLACSLCNVKREVAEKVCQRETHLKEASCQTFSPARRAALTEQRFNQVLRCGSVLCVLATGVTNRSYFSKPFCALVDRITATCPIASRDRATLVCVAVAAAKLALDKSVGTVKLQDQQLMKAPVLLALPPRSSTDCFRKGRDECSRFSVERPCAQESKTASHRLFSLASGILPNLTTPLTGLGFTDKLCKLASSCYACFPSRQTFGRCEKTMLNQRIVARMANSSLVHAVFLLVGSMGVLEMRDYFPSSVKENAYFVRLCDMVGVDGSITMVAAALALVWSSASVLLYLMEIWNGFKSSDAAMSSVYVNLNAGMDEKRKSSGRSFQAVRNSRTALQGGSYENQYQEQGNLDVSGIFTDNEGENIEKKGKLVSVLPAGKWVKENDKDWKVVERMKTKMDLLLNFPNAQPQVSEEVVYEAPVEETMRERQPEQAVFPPIKGDPVVFCLANCELKVLRGGNLLRDSNYLRARREMWIDRYKKSARMVCDAVNEALRSSRAVSGRPPSCRLALLAKNYPEALVTVTILSLLLAILMGISCYMDNGGMFRRLEELVTFVLRAIGTRLQSLIGKA